MAYALHEKYTNIKYCLTITQSTKLGKWDKNKAETNSTEYGLNSNTTAFLRHLTEPQIMIVNHPLTYFRNLCKRRSYI
jgi:hypothetical protein